MNREFLKGHHWPMIVAHVKRVAACSSPGLPPAWLLSHGAQLGDLGSLPRLRDAAATFPFASSTSSKVEHVSQRHTQRMLTGTGT